MKRVFTLLLLALGIQYAHAQWNSDTEVNLGVSELEAGDLHTAATKDGKTWVAYYAPVNGQYHMRAQLLDKDGYKLLGDDGVVVNDYPSGTATFTFSVCLDADDNFIIAAQDNRSGKRSTVVYKIDQSGKSYGMVAGA